MKSVTRLVAILAIVVLGACAVVPGPFNGLSKDEMAMLIIYRTDGKPLTTVQYNKVVAVAKRMGIVIGWQLSSAFEAGATSGFAYGGAGALGGGTQGHFYPGANSGAAAGYTGVVYGLGGVVNGMVTASYANIHALEKAVDDAIQDGVKYDNDNDLKRIHVVGAYIRSNNTASNPAANLVPNYSGPVAGSSQK